MKKISVKLLSFFLALLFILPVSAGLIPTAGAEPVETWISAAASAFAGGDGNPETPYQISSAAELAFFAKQVNAGEAGYVDANYVLTADIDLSGKEWTPVGSSETPFAGTFDGAGKTITGLTIETATSGNVGFIACLAGEDAALKDLTVSLCINVDLGENAGVVGGLVADLKGAVSNCTVNGAILVAGSKGLFIGGIAGVTNSAASLNGVTTNAAMELNVPTTGSFVYCGGLVGQADSTKRDIKTFVNCANTGSMKINCQTGSNTAIAGIVGVTNSCGEADAKVVFEDCVTTATISCIAGSSDLIGGIVGYSRAAQNDVQNLYSVTYTNCISAGKITFGNTDCAYGITGSSRTDSTFTNCLTTAEFIHSWYVQKNGTTDIPLMINGEEVSRTANASQAHTPATCATVVLVTPNLAQIRMPSDASAADAGIRFFSYVEKSSVDALNAVDGLEWSVGTLLAPTENFDAAPIVNSYDKRAALDKQEGKTYADLPYTGAFLTETTIPDQNLSEHCYFSAAIRNIKAEHYESGFSAIAYLTVKLNGKEFSFYSDYDATAADRSRTVAQVAKTAFEDRLTEAKTLNGKAYKFEANADNECYVGTYSPYSNEQLALLKIYCKYVNDPKLGEGLRIGGIPAANYTIVYAHSILEDSYGSGTGLTAGADLKDYLIGDNADYDYDHETALLLQSTIKKKFGITIPVAQDNKTPESTYEILVGKTNRSKTQTKEIQSLGVDDYVLRIDDTKLVICGGIWGSTYHAVSDLSKKFKGKDQNFEWRELGDLSGSYTLKKIACLGDSITRGSQALPDGGTYAERYEARTGQKAPTALWGGANGTYLENFLSYPANLQRELWKDYVIYNFGRGASTLCNYGSAQSTSPYYRETTQFQNCLSTGKKVTYNAVLIMLGTNDSGKINGGNQGTYTFLEEYKYLIDQIAANSPSAKFVIMNAPYRCNGGSPKDPTVRMTQEDAAIALKAKGYNVYLYDMGTYTTEKLIDPALEFQGDEISRVDYWNIENGDGTHPDYNGYHVMALGLVDFFDYLINFGDANKYVIDITQ